MNDRYKDIEIEIVGRNYEPEPVAESTQPEIDEQYDDSFDSESEYFDSDDNTTESAQRKNRSILNIFLGNYIAGEAKSMLPYIVFVTILAIIYIFNGFAMNAQHRKHSRLTEQVKELRSKAMTINAQKMQDMQRSSILKRCQERGIELEESVVPPKIVEK
jgi:hypothetical protein